jgi:hypothetical protein
MSHGAFSIESVSQTIILLVYVQILIGILLLNSRQSIHLIWPKLMIDVDSASNLTSSIRWYRASWKPSIWTLAHAVLEGYHDHNAVIHRIFIYLPFVNYWLPNSPESQLSLFPLEASKSWPLHFRLDSGISDLYHMIPKIPGGVWRLQNVNRTACSHTVALAAWARWHHTQTPQWH